LALVVLVAIDAWAPDWDPDVWSYLVAAILIVWGPSMLPAIRRS
jgi:hypothetical protein